MSTVTSRSPDQRPSDQRYTSDSGRVLMTGVQSLVRLVADQMRADHAEGRSTAALVTGYQGSPLGGLDTEFLSQRALTNQLGIEVQPAVNEELAATAAWGSQLVPGMPNPRVEGVLGVWYGKTPGVDRAGDALRHGNFVGAHPAGGLLALCGDDPSAKSSTIPGASERTLAALGIPVFYPGTPAECLDLGRHAIACSRASGLWTAMKLVTNVADGVGDVEVDRSFRAVVPTLDSTGRAYVHEPSGNLIPPHTAAMEETLWGPRLDLAKAYARVNGLNTRIIDSEDARLGIISAGKPYYDLREAFLLLGLQDDQLRHLGVRLLKMGMIWPADTRTIRDFASGLDEIVVIEEKGPFLESAVRDSLYDMTTRPRVLGSHDENGDVLFPASGVLTSKVIADVLATRLQRVDTTGATATAVPESGRSALRQLPVMASRTPFFCSGCPHNRSTDAPDDALVGGGIGCHAMVLLSPSGKGQVTGMTQMGGEGGQWIGQAPFVAESHLIQNLGDGTFSHSGSLALRAAVSSGVSMTYKILVNSAVAMTGGQQVVGQMSIPDLTRWLQAEGVKRTVVTTDQTRRYRRVKLASNAVVRDRGELMATQEELRGIEGVTVLIHDQECAAELRRKRKRGQADDPPRRIHVNQRVCEGCGDCGSKSHCLSVVPVETEFGTKTRIDQTSCNKDYSCLDGDCPSFITVVPNTKAKQRSSLPPPPLDLPEPEVLVDPTDTLIRLVGIGGTGVVTIARILATAALNDGKFSVGLDQTGLSQKGGPVVSDIRVLENQGTSERSSAAPLASVDAYLGFDLLGALKESNLETLHPARSVAVVSTSRIPTGQMIGDPDAGYGDVEQAIRVVLSERTRPGLSISFDAMDISRRLLGTTQVANSLVVGVAYQRGVIPLSTQAIEDAFRENGAAVETNIAAFRWGRAIVAAPAAVADALPEALREQESPPWIEELLRASRIPEGSELQRLLRIRARDLADYQNRAYAQRYIHFVAAVLRKVQATGADNVQITELVARHLHRLMAYKDEYEVARLHLDPAERARLRQEFGDDAQIKYMLHPPILKAFGLKKKLALGTWFDPVFRLLKALRVLRGTVFDVFGYTRERRLERSLPDRYEQLIDAALPYLAESPDGVAELCALPEIIRGYSHLKLENIAIFLRRADEGLRALGKQGASVS